MKRYIWLLSIIVAGLLASCNGDSNTSSNINNTAPGQVQPGGGNPPPPPPPPPPASAKLITITVTPKYNDSANLAVGFSRQYLATGYYDDGSSMDLTNGVLWSSTNPACAKLDEKTPGLIVATSSDNCVANIDVSLINKNNNNLTVNPSLPITTSRLELSVKKLKLTAINIQSNSVIIPMGIKEHYTAIAIFNDGSYSNITNQVSWTANSPAILNPDATESGAFYANKAGVATISAKLGLLVESKLDITVTNAKLESIYLVAKTPYLTTLHINTTTHYKAYGYYSDNTLHDISQNVNWLSSNPKLLNVNKYGEVLALASSNGKTVAINATMPNSKIEAATTQLYVSNKTLDKLVVHSAGGVDLISAIANQYKAIGYYADGVQDLTDNVYWAIHAESGLATISNQTQTKGRLISYKGSAASNYVIANFAKVTNKLPGLPFSVTKMNLKDINIIGIPNLINNLALGQLVEYKAIARFVDGTSRDITNQVVWSSSANSKLSTLNTAGAFYSQSDGAAVIKASYLNPISGEVEYESSISLQISATGANSIESIELNPATVEVAAKVNNPIHYSYSARLVDDKGNYYTATSGHVIWSILSSNGFSKAEIDQEGNLIAIPTQESAQLVIQAKLGGNKVLQTQSNLIFNQAIALNPSVNIAPATGGAPDLDSSKRLDQIFYIPNSGIIKHCIVSNRSNSNEFITQSLSPAYLCLNLAGSPKTISTHNILRYNSRYKKVYTISKNIIYSIDPYASSIIVESIAKLDFDGTVGGFDFDRGESHIYIAALPVAGKITLYTCAFENNGGLNPNTCIKTITDIQPAASATHAYIVNYMDKYAYIKLNVVYKGSHPESDLYKCDITSGSVAANCTNLFAEDAPSVDHDGLERFVQPAIHTTKGGLDVLYLNEFNYTSTPSYIFLAAAIGESGHLSIVPGSEHARQIDPYSITPSNADGGSPGAIPYASLAFDDVNNWLYFGNSTKGPLVKCSYSSGINPYGKANGGCVTVTDFEDVFAGITFVPGLQPRTPYNPKIIKPGEINKPKLFFISQSYNRNDESYAAYSVVGCNNADESITAEDCQQYTLPGVSADNELIYSNVYHKVYATSTKGVVYAMNPATHQIDISPVPVISSAIALNQANTRAFLVAGSDESVARLYNCQIDESGSISNSCSITRLTAPSLGKVMSPSIVNYKDKALYILLTNPANLLSVLYKCDIKDGVNIGNCNILYTNDSSNIYIYKIAAIRDNTFGDDFIYLNGINYDSPIGNGPKIIYSSYTIKAEINPYASTINKQDIDSYNTSPGLITTPMDAISGDKVAFADATNYAYIGVSQLPINIDEIDSIFKNMNGGTAPILKCTYTADITTSGDVSNTCIPATAFKPYSSTSLIYIPMGN